jgi:histidinol phosphatase-like enzyme
MLITASVEMDIDLAHSYTVGDMLKDIQVVDKVGAKGVLVKTGYGLNTIEKELRAESAGSIQPHYIAEDILDAVKWILQDRMRR